MAHFGIDVSKAYGIRVPNFCKFIYQYSIETANNILAQQNKKANWVALDTLKELNSDAVLARHNLR